MLCHNLMSEILIHYYIFHKNQTQYSKKNAPVKYLYQVNRLLNMLENKKTITPINKEQQLKINTFMNPVIMLAKIESLKIVLAANYLSLLKDESKFKWPIEPIK